MVEAVAVPLFSILLYITSLFAPADTTEIAFTIGNSTIVYIKSDDGKWETYLPVDEGTLKASYWVERGDFKRQVRDKVQSYTISDYLQLPFDKSADAFTIKADKQTVTIEKGVGYLVFRPQADPDAPPIRATWRTAADD